MSRLSEREKIILVTMARFVSSSSHKEVITDVVTTTLQQTTSRLVPAHSDAFPFPISTGPVESVKLAANDQIVDGVRLESIPKEKLPRGRVGIGILSVRQASWRVPAGASPAQVRRSGRLVVSVAWWKVTTTAKRTQRLCGVGY